MRAPLLAAGLLLLCPAERTARAVYTERLIQVCIQSQARGLTVTPEGRFSLRDEATGTGYDLLPYKTYPVDAAAGGLLVGPYRFAGPARLAPLEPGATVLAGKSRYQGHLLIKPGARGTVLVVSELSVEDYLLGVLPREMEPNWPLEALKAQAVVARTFAYYNLGKYKEDGFDLTSDTRSQVYGGIANQSAAVRQAVAQTRGEVLGYQGALLAAYYHACCGGHTADYTLVWGGAAPLPLRGVEDRFCTRTPLYRWKAFVPAAEVLAALPRGGKHSGRLEDFSLGRRDGAGYVRSFTVKVGGESVSVSGEEFRKSVGPTRLRSLRLRSARLRRDGVWFEGTGSGHGVGLCQWGSRAQAEKGRSYETILRYYFPGATLSVVDE